MRRLTAGNFAFFVGLSFLHGLAGAQTRDANIDLDSGRKEAMALVESDPDDEPAAVCPMELPNGAMPFANKGVHSLVGSCQVAAIARRAYALALAINKSVWCSDPDGIKSKTRELERLMDAEDLKTRGATAESLRKKTQTKDGSSKRDMEASVASQSDASTLSRGPAYFDRKELEACSSWPAYEHQMAPSITVESSGEMTWDGKKCRSFMIRARLISGRWHGGAAHFIVGDGECRDKSFGFERGSETAFASAEGSKRHLDRILSSEWAGPDPEEPSFRYAQTPGRAKVPKQPGVPKTGNWCKPFTKCVDKASF